MQYRSKIVLITGAGSGLGKAMAIEFLSRGHRVIATDINSNGLHELQVKGAWIQQLNVTLDTQIDEFFSTIKEKFGSVDILINNAGYGELGPILEVAPDRLRHQLAVNTVAPHVMIQQAVELMIPIRNGLIINIGSVSGVLVTPFVGAYCASKAALHALSHALRMELAPFNIKVLLVQPGAIESHFGEVSAEIVRNTVTRKSRYYAIFDIIHARALLSQKSATPVQDCARAIVNEALQPSPKPFMRVGKNSFFMPFLKKWFPIRTLDRYLMKRFGLCGSDLSPR